MWVAIAAFLSALPAFFFAVVAMRQRGTDSYEDRLEKEAADLRAENESLRERLDTERDENLRLMKKLLANGGSKPS